MTRDELQNAPRKTQLEEMETWFRENFCDPVERLPYDSAEGGFQWIFGGPYSASEELADEFSGCVPDDVIEELAYRLEEENYDWCHTERDSDYE